ncbi:MAG TPA: ABC transporter ATP-binding protein [Steroidobacteraceae bacterium]|nr:ABC transporter ATP-binding protein [Steroidobacteraceae bacterium]
MNQTPGGASRAARGRPTAVLAARNVSIRIGGRDLVKELTLELSPGQFVAVLGRNGSGKTLTLHTLAGMREPHRGTVTLNGKPLQQLGRRAVARSIGLLTQDFEDGFAGSVLESVLISRHPHLALWQWETAEDDRLANEALAALDLTALTQRRTDTLSGGERRRVAVAGLLAQQPAIYVLDEPTNHLDPHHQLAVLSLFHELTRRGHSVIAALHDATLAARFADRAVLLFGDGRWVAGPARETISARALAELYLTPMEEIEKNGRRIFTPA